MADDKNITTDDVLSYFLRMLMESEKISYVHKPISHALYMTWLHFNEIENERKGRL